MAKITFSDEEICLLQKEANEKYDFIRLNFVDIVGRARSKNIPSRNLSKVIRNGLGIYQGCQMFGCSHEMCPTQLNDTTNSFIIPQSKIIYPVSWASSTGNVRIGEILCENFRANGEHHCTDTRWQARRQLERLANHGYKLYSGFEFELTLFDKETKTTVEKDMFSNEVPANTEQDFAYTIINQFPSKNPELGAGLSYFNTEYGAGQFEYVFEPSKQLAPANESYIFRDIFKTLGPRFGYNVNIMAKPSPERLGNGLHYSTSLWDEDFTTNLFHDSKSPDKMSELMKHWIGGLCKHGIALQALCAPTVNCFRRFHQPWAPGIPNWGHEDRYTSFRTKTDSAGSTLVENRLPSSIANTYLIMAATVAAGLDGIINKINPPTKEDMEVMPKLAINLEEALLELEKSEVMAHAFGSDFINIFCEMKRAGEISTLGTSDVSNTNEERLKQEWNEYSHL